jgi:hypothetical protein
MRWSKDCSIKWASRAQCGRHEAGETSVLAAGHLSRACDISTDMAEKEGLKLQLVPIV